MKGGTLYEKDFGFEEQWFHKGRSTVSCKARTEEEERIADKYLKMIKKILKRTRYDMVLPKSDKE